MFISIQYCTFINIPRRDYAGRRITPKRTPKLGTRYDWEKANFDLSGKNRIKALSRTKLRYCRTDSYLSSKSSTETISLTLPEEVNALFGNSTSLTVLDITEFEDKV